MRVDEQYETYIKQLTNRKRSPVKGATLAAYGSYWRRWVQPELGALEVAQIENGAMKKLVARLSKDLSAATIAGVTNLVKGIVSSAVDDNGNELYPRKWNGTYIDAPLLDPRNQKAPIMTRESLQEAISRTQDQFRTLCILLAGSGLRISEALALKGEEQEGSSFWDSEGSKLVINKALWRGHEQSTKTGAGVREVDLAPELNEYLLQNVTKGNTFCFGGEKPIRLATIYDAAKDANIPGFHALRRWRVTHLRSNRVPEDIIRFWIGHSGKSITDRYSKMAEDIEIRKKYAAEAGLGFELP